jgi:hypothetical protein
MAIQLVGCTKQTMIGSHAQLGTLAARQVGSFHTVGHRELTPPNIEESVLDHEATLVNDRCVQLVLRDQQDWTITDYAPLLVVDGDKVETTISDEHTRLRVLLGSAHAEQCDNIGGLSASVVAYCLTERAAKLCGSTSGREIDLSISIRVR